MPDKLAAAGALLLLAPSAYVASLLDAETQKGLQSRALVGIATFAITTWMVPTIAVFTERKGLFGKDLGKRFMPSLREIRVPEALGIVSAIAFLVAVIGCEVMYATTAEDKANYASSMTSICFMVLLGFMDDVLDLPWRVKLILPTIASLPLLVAYTGSTSVVVPRPLRALLVAPGAASAAAAAAGAATVDAAPRVPGMLTELGALLDRVPCVVVDAAGHGAILELGGLYLVYMGALAVFCTNAINIYAGINGLEAGQSFVIGCAMLLYGLLQVRLGSADADQYLFAVTLILPFLGATLGLLRHNWFPSRVFVGDTFCYFAGMTFAVVGIQGHFTKPLLLFFVPQIANFLYSVPQLFKLVPCPRHRLPVPDENLGQPRGTLMVPSTFEAKPGSSIFWKRLHGLPASAGALPNFTVINWALAKLGPVSERDLCVALLALQAATCAAALALRYSAFASYLFDG